MIDKLQYNTLVCAHHLARVLKAQKLLESFMKEDDGVVYISNPDGSCIKLQNGFKLYGITYSEKVED